MNFRNPSEVTSIEILEEEVAKVLLLEDEGIVRMVTACAVGAKMDISPIWLMLVAGSSGGKTAFISALSGLDFVHEISDLTINTFASGQRATQGKETSLLMKLSGGMMSFKDFTSIISKNKEARREIMGQLREIYDGQYTKRTGNSCDVVWKGRVGAIAGCTEVIYYNMQEMAAMGDRFIMYAFKQPDRKELAKRSIKNSLSKVGRGSHVSDCFKAYITHVTTAMDAFDIYQAKFSDKMLDELIDIADLSSAARSSVLRNFKTGSVEFVPEKELPMRILEQTIALASAFVVMNLTNPNIASDHPAKRGCLTDTEKQIIYKTAFDSIPRQRRNVIIPLAKYLGGVSTSGIATHLGLPTDTVRGYLTELNALDICMREKNSSPAQGDIWKIKEEYRRVVKMMFNLKEDIGMLAGPDISDESDLYKGIGGPDKKTDMLDIFEDSLDGAF